MKTSAPIGVFDSGVGGLTVAREIMRQIPNERIVYFGDTARVPYGSKSKETITKYSKQIIRFLKTEEVKAIVIACNTASAFALEEIKAELDIPIIGVVRPGAVAAAQVTKNKRIGIIATEGTINSGIYDDYIHRLDSEIKVIKKACPLFVPLVEEGMLDDSVTTQMATRYLNYLKNEDIDTLILGCTHYPLLTNTIADIMGDKVELVNPAFETARELKELLKDKNLANVQQYESASIMYRFYVSDAAQKFSRFANSIMPFDIMPAKQIDIDRY